MAIVNSAATVTPGFDSTLVFQKLANALVDGVNTINIPTVPSLARGMIRVKIYNGAGTSPAFTNMAVNAKDGTNSVRLGEMDVHPNTAFALSATTWYEMIADFIVDTGLASGNGGSTGVMLAQGATSFDFLITISRTSETATCDIEICGT